MKKKNNVATVFLISVFCYGNILYFLDVKLCAKLSNTSLDSISSREEQVKSALEVMEKMGIVDLSPLKGLVKSFFELAASYDQDHSNMADKRSEEEKLKLLSNAKERLQSFKLEESEQLEQVSYSQEAVKKIEVRLEKLQNLKEEHEAAIEAGQKETEEIRTKIQAVKDEISSYDDVDVLKAEDSSNLEEKKGCLKAIREELMNYKLCFD